MPIATSTRLPLRCEPIPGESLNGFLARLAERNHFTKAAWVADLAGIRFPQVWYSDDALERLAAVTEIEAVALRDIAPPPPRSKVSFTVSTVLGHNVSTEAFVRDGRRICPQCMAQSPHHRIAWDMRFVRSCVDHGTQLLAACPECRRKLDWRTSSVRLCKCGFDLTTAQAAIVAAEAQAATRHLQAMLLDIEQPVPVLLAELEFHEVFYLLSRFGHFRGGGIEFVLDDSIDPSVEIWLANGLTVLSQDAGELERMLKTAALLWSQFPNRATIALLEEVRGRLEEMGRRAATLSEIVGRALEDPQG